jgi:Tfp pilus assembly protein PilV
VKITKAATSVIEAMVIMLIVVTGVIWMYNIYIESIRLSDVTAQRLQAIQIAREWVEAVENIRNTNWILYAADYKNCWNTRDYSNLCIWNDALNTDIEEWNYIIYQNTSSRWQLDRIPTATVAPSIDNFSQAYRDTFEVFRDNEWFYTQSWSTTPATPKTSISPIFTREIRISYPSPDSNANTMDIKSIVQWPSRSDKPHEIILDLTLANWKDK